MKVYNRGGNLVGTVVGLDVEGQELRRAGEEWQLIGKLAGTLALRKSLVHFHHNLKLPGKFVSIRGYRFLITYFRFGVGG